MDLLIANEPVALEIDADGVARVGGTRVTLDTVVTAFLDGATAEEITQRYPTLDLADVYTVIGYYLHRREEVDAYLRRRQAGAMDVRRENESRFGLRGVRERLLKRRASQDRGS